MQRSFRPVLVLLSGRMVGVAVTFFVPVVLTRALSPAQFGTYKQIFLLFATLYAVAQLGMAECLYYFLPSDPRCDGRYLVNSLMLLLAAGTVGSILLCWAATPIANGLGNASLDQELYLVAVFLLLMLCTAVLEITMIARQSFRLAAFSYIAFDVLRAGALIVPVLIFGTIHALLVGATLFASVRLAFTFIYLLLSTRGLQWDVTLLKRQLAYALPFAAAVLLDTVTIRFHQYVVAAAFDPAIFAVYAVACLQVPLPDYLASSAGDVLMVRVSECRRDGKPDAALAAWHDTIRKLALSFLPMLALLLVAAPDLIEFFFTASYVASVPLFRLGSLAILVLALPTNAMLRAFAQTRFLLVVNILRLAVLALAIYPLVSALQLTGAMLVSLFAVVFPKLFELIRIRRILATPLVHLLPWRSLAGTAAVAAAAGGLTGIVRAQLAWPPAAALAACVVICGSTYALLAVRSGVVRRHEWQALFRWLRRSTVETGVEPV